MNQAQFLRFFTDGDGVTRRAGEMVLAVAGHLRVDLHVLGHHDFQLAVAVHHNRTAAEGVRVHRNYDDGIQLGMHDRATGRHGVGGRTGGSGHNQAVGLLAADELAVDMQFEFDHAR